MPSLQILRTHFRAFATERVVRAVKRGGAVWLGIFLTLFGLGLRAQTDGTKQWAANVQGFITLSSPALSPDGSVVYVGVETQTGGRLIAFTREGVRKWNFDRAEAIESSPAIGADGTIYVGCGDGKLYALNPDNGSIRWAFATQTFVTSSPAIAADGTIYFGAGDSRLHALNPDGTQRWSFLAGNWIDSSPAVGADGTIYFGSFDNRVYAVTRDGVQKWSFQTGGRVFSSPAIGADGTVYVGSGDQRLYALAPDGMKKWDYFANGDIQASPTLGADGTIYFAADVNLYALKPDGTERWKSRINTSASSAAVRGDGAIILGGDDGIVRALNPTDGSEKWRFDTRSGSGNLIESSPVIATDGSIYIGSFDGFLYKLNGSGTPLSTLSAWPAFHRDPQRQGRALTISGNGRLLNLSTRAQVGGTETLIAGFVVQGVGQRAYLMRGVGPALAAFGLAGMPDPRLRVFSGTAVIGANDDWGNNEGGLSAGDTGAAVGAFPLPNGSKDAALVLPLPAGPYTAHVSATDGRGGVVLIEAYDAVAGDATARLVNLSTRGQVGVGASQLFAGVVVGGTGKSRLMLRGIGPGLAQFGVSGVLARPTLALFNGVQQLLRTNTGWTTEVSAYDLVAAAQLVGAFALDATSADCAMIVTVDPGIYTLQISGVGGTTGEALVEIYTLP